MNIYEMIDKMTVERKTIFDMPLRVTFYARVSTHKDEQLNSRENQIQTFTEMIKNNANWEFVDGYVDTIRGETAVNRTNFQRMIDDSKTNKFDLIICKEISRFSRDLLDSISYTRELFKNNVGVYFTSDNLCTIDRDSELRLGIMASIAQQEVARLSERVKFGHKKSIENGVVMGNSRIFGYTKQNGKLVIDEHEAKMVKMIYELYATGDYSLREISEVLEKQGFLNHSGNPIAHTTIKAIIKNPKNKGYYCGNKVKILDYRTKQQKFLPEEQWVMYKDETGEIVPAIVDEELWNRCNEMLTKRCVSPNSGNDGGKRFTSPLSGKIVCGHCGKSYHHNSYGHGRAEIKWHWICQIKKKKSSDCPSFSIKDEEMIAILRMFFQSFITNIDDYINKYISIYEEQLSGNYVNNSINSINNEIKNLEAKKEKLLDLYTDDLISKAEFKSRNDKLQIQIDSLILELAELSAKEDTLQNTVAEFNKIKKYFSQGSISKNDMNDTLVLELSKTLINKVIIEPVSKNNAKVIIIPMFGDETNVDIFKHNNGMTIGAITKKMIPIVTYTESRYMIPHTKNNEYINIKYDIFMSIR